MPRHDHVAFNPGDEGIKPVMQELSHSRFSEVFDAAIQPALEGVRVVSS